MVTTLKPHVPRHKPSIADEELPGTTPSADSELESDAQLPKGIELGDMASAKEGEGSASAPGEGPNPTK